jgi:metal-responsive CopG/Arc/MetJ family transcriptional regulator
MTDQLTVRLPKDLGVALEAASRKMRRSSSEIVRMALRQFLQVPSKDGKTRAQHVRTLLGSLESGIPDLAERHREYILESLKHGR